MSDVILSNIQIWRQKARDGTLTIEEARQAVDAIRKDRVGAQVVSTASKVTKAKAAAKAAPIDSNALLDDFMN